MSGPSNQEGFLALNDALADWDWGRAHEAAHELDSSHDPHHGGSVVRAVEEARDWVDRIRDDTSSLLPEECEKWNPYKPAYVAYTPEGRVVWRCTHTSDEGNGPHEIELAVPS